MSLDTNTQPQVLDTIRLITEQPTCGNFASHDELQITFSMVGNCTDQALQPATASWHQLRTELLGCIPAGQVRGVKDGPGWIPATFTDTSAGRSIANVDAMTCIVLDVDHGMSFDESVKRIEAFQYEAMFHTSYSHSPDEDRFRVILPLGQPIKAKQIKPLFDFLQTIFDGKLDPACMEPSRLFYLPACPEGHEHLFRHQHIRGNLLSLNDAVNTTGVATAIKTMSTKSVISTPPWSVFPKAERGYRHATLTKIIGSLLARGHDDQSVMTHAIAWNDTLDAPLPESEIAKTVTDICDKNRRNRVELQTEWDTVVKSMNQNYAWLSTPMVTYRLKDGVVVNPTSMQSNYANRHVTIDIDGKSRPANHYEAWLKSPIRREHNDLTFLPGQPEIVNNCVNLWKAWGAKSVPGNIEPWTKFLDYIFGTETTERRWIEQWFAYPLQYPGAKLKSCVVIWSIQQGVGKSLLGSTIGKLYGPHAKTITGKELHGKFNGWTQNSLFVLGEENSSGDHRADSNKLKELITGDTVFVEEKYRPATSCPNQMNFMFTSNHPDAFHLETADRRYFVWSIDKPPMDAKFYDDFIGWRDSEVGLSALMAHLTSLDLTGFDPNGHAPMTNAKREMKDMSMTELERWICDILSDETIDSRLKSEVISTQQLVRLFQSDSGAVRSSDTALTKALRRQAPYAKRRVSIGKGKKVSLVSLRNHDKWEQLPDAVWVAEYNKYTMHALED